MEVVMIRWANDDAPVPTSSELFFKILTPSHSVSLLTPRANRNCGSDTAPEIEASGLVVDRSTESCRGGGGKAQQSRWWREVAPRVELFPSLSLCCESHLLAFNSMNESTNRENFMV